MRNGNLLPAHWRRASVLGELFNDFDGLFAAAPTQRSDWAPEASRFAAADIAENEKSFLIHLDVPGFTKDEIKVEILADRLTVRAEKISESEDKKDKTFHLRERSLRKIERTFHLGDRAHVEGVQARYENGVLSLEIPKKEATQQKIIPIS